MTPDELKRRQDLVFQLMENAAINGLRCPTFRDMPPGCNHVPVALALQGRIKIEVMASNWRVVTIMEGPNTGKATARPPFGTGKPYRMIYRGRWTKRRGWGCASSDAA
jgi:hypothetical protein